MQAAATRCMPHAGQPITPAPLLDVGHVHECSAAGGGASCCGAGAGKTRSGGGAAAALHPAVLACSAGRRCNQMYRAQVCRPTSAMLTWQGLWHAASAARLDCTRRSNNLQLPSPASPLMALLLGLAVPADGRPLVVPSRTDASRCGAAAGRPRLLGPAGAAGRAGRAVPPARPAGPLPVSMLPLWMAPAEQPGVSPDSSCISMSCTNWKAWPSINCLCRARPRCRGKQDRTQGHSAALHRIHCQRHGAATQ